MKTKFLILASMLFLMVFQCASAVCTNCHTEDSSITLPEKTYLTLDQIALQDSSIYVQLEGQVFEVPAIYSDSSGFYIKTVKQPRGRCEPYEWKCPRCGRCNTFDYDKCPDCRTEME